MNYCYYKSYYFRYDYDRFILFGLQLLNHITLCVFQSNLISFFVILINHYILCHNLINIFSWFLFSILIFYTILPYWFLFSWYWYFLQYLLKQILMFKHFRSNTRHHPKSSSLPEPPSRTLLYPLLSLALWFLGD